MAVNTVTPTSVSLPQLDANYLTSENLINMYENAKEDVDSTRYLRYGRNNLGIQELLRQLGQTKEVKGNVYSHFEQDWRDEIIRVTASYTAAGATATFTVDSSYNFSYPTAGSIYTSSTTSYAVTPRVGDVLEMSEVPVRVTAVTVGATSTFAVVCTQTGDTIPSGLASVEIFKIGRMEAEGGSTPENTETRDLKYENKIGIIAEGYKSTGTSMIQEGVVNATNGKPYYFEQGIIDTRFKFEDTCDSVLFTGKKITSTNAAFSNINATEGLIPFIRNYGNEETYSVGAFSLTDIENMSLTLGKYQGAEDNMLITSQALQIEIDNLLRTSPGLLAGGVTYDKLADFGFKAMTYGGVTYNFKTLRAFSNIKNFGSADSVYKSMGLVIPMGNTTAFDLGKERINVPSLELCYASTGDGGESMGYKEWVTGGAGLANTDDTDTKKINMRKRVGFQAYGPNRYGIFVSA
tara:strand:+ start:9579 stop:10970 length:1392 start_codon:yes stop_codon:yes gene_type:complete